MILLASLAGLLRWVHEELSLFWSPGFVKITEWILAGISVILVVVLMAVLMIYMERKVAAFMQMRLGPMRVGKWGTMQAFADVLKLLIKEILIPERADKLLFSLAPYLVLCVSFLMIAPFAFAPGVQLWDTNIGVIYVISISSLGVIGILMAGWSSNNKYSLLGAMRSGAQVVSYELSAGLSMLTMMLFTGSLQMSEIIASQQDGWWIFKGHFIALFAFMSFLISITAELNRAPFDLAEAESELAAGFHTEYSGMQFAMFFLAEYTNMFVAAMLISTVFLGGWMPLHISHLTWFNHIMDLIPGSLWFFGKIIFIVFIIMWFRWTFPRLRIDQLLRLEWKYLMPLNLINILIAALFVLMGWYF